MNPTKNPFCNTTFQPPQSDPHPGIPKERVAALEVFSDGHVCLSAWQPTPEEIEAINKGAPVWVFVYAGGMQPTLALSACNVQDMLLNAGKPTPQPEKPKPHPEAELMACPCCGQISIPFPRDYAVNQYRQRYEAASRCQSQGCEVDVVIFWQDGNTPQVERAE